MVRPTAPPHLSLPVVVNPTLVSEGPVVVLVPSLFQLKRVNGSHSETHGPTIFNTNILRRYTVSSLNVYFGVSMCPTRTHKVTPLLGVG